MLLKALSWVRSIVYTIPLIILSTVIAGIAAIVSARFGPRGNFQDRCTRAWARTVLAVSGVRAEASGMEKLDSSEAYVFISNHCSYMDPPIILACLRHPVRFVAKQSLFKIPIFGSAMRAFGHLPMDRENARAAARNLATAEGILRAGSSILIFPEGGRSLDGVLQPFLSGAFRLAIKAQSPIVPLAVVGSRETLAPGSLNIHGGRVKLLVGDPIPTRGMSARDRDALAAEAWKSLSELLHW